MCMTTNNQMLDVHHMDFHTTQALLGTRLGTVHKHREHSACCQREVARALMATFQHTFPCRNSFHTLGAVMFYSGNTCNALSAAKFVIIGHRLDKYAGFTLNSMVEFKIINYLKYLLFLRTIVISY